MAKITLSSLVSGFLAIAGINQNFSDIEDEFQDKVLYRDNPAGEPNSMQCNIDMNGYNLLNLGNASAVTTLTGVSIIAFGNQRNGTGTHSLSVGDIYRDVEVSASSSVTACVLITTEATSGITADKWVGFYQTGLGPVKFVADAGVTLYAKSIRTNVQYGYARLHYKGTDVWYLSGDLSAS